MFFRTASDHVLKNLCSKNLCVRTLPWPGDRSVDWLAYGTGQKLFERLSGEKPRRASEHDYDAVFSSGAEAKSQFDEVSKREPDRRGFKDSSVKYLKGKYISS